jgi:hypothetical protein
MPVRIGVVGSALLVGLHLLMLAGMDQGAMRMPTHVRQADMEAGHDTDTVLSGQWADGHNMAASCLAVLAGLMLLRATPQVTVSRRPPARAVLAKVSALRPPTPPPIALGISRT